MARGGEQYLWPAHDVPAAKRPVQAAAPRQTARPPAAAASQRAAPPAEKRQFHAAPATQGAHAAPAERRAASPPPPPAPSARAAPGATRKKPVIASLAKPPPRPERPRLRGSLSEQLANISAHTDTMISGLKQSVSKDGGEMGTPTLLVYCNNMVVGRAESQFSAAVSFYSDKVCYAFQHAREKRIDMLMYYKDMREVKTDDRKARLSFRICKTLEHFSKDYDHTNPAHALIIPFSKADYAGFKAKVLPLILAMCK